MPSEFLIDVKTERDLDPLSRSIDVLFYLSFEFLEKIDLFLLCLERLSKFLKFIIYQLVSGDLKEN